MTRTNKLTKKEILKAVVRAKKEGWRITFLSEQNTLMDVWYDEDAGEYVLYIPKPAEEEYTRFTTAKQVADLLYNFDYVYIEHEEPVYTKKDIRRIARQIADAILSAPEGHVDMSRLDEEVALMLVDGYGIADDEVIEKITQEVKKML